MKRFILICFSIGLLLPSILFGKTTIVKGFAQEFANQRLSYYEVREFLTERRTFLGEVEVASNGQFKLSFDCKNITNIYLSIQNRTAHLYAEPGKIYNIILSKNPEEDRTRVYDRTLSIRAQYPNPKDLNVQISKVNRTIDQFLSDNERFFSIRNEEVYSLLAKFRFKMADLYASHSSEYLKNHVKYSIANLEMGLKYFNEGSKNARNIQAMVYKTYLNKQPVLTNHAEYLRLFKDFFKGYFKKITLTEKGYGITEGINDFASLKTIDNTASKYLFFKDKAFRELFILNGFLEIKNDDFFNFKNRIKILHQIQKTSLSDDIKIMTKNILDIYNYKHQKVKPKAPDFNLKNKSGKTVSLDNISDSKKLIYIHFFAYWSIESLTEMKLIEKLYAIYHPKVTFISICTDGNFKKFQSFIKRHAQYKWQLLWIPEKNRLLDQLDIKVIPTYLLLDPQQNILSFPAPRPSGGIDRETEINISTVFDEFLKKK